MGQAIDSQILAVKAQLERSDAKNTRLTEELAAAERENGRVREAMAARVSALEVLEAVTVPHWKDRAEAAEQKLAAAERENAEEAEAEARVRELVARLTEALARALRALETEHTAAMDAEARVRELEALNQDSCEKWQAAEASLAAATALLALARDAIDEECYPVWWEHWRAFLARAFLDNQPTAPTCTEADQAVLNDLALVPADTLHWLRLNGPITVHNVAVSELARRGLK